MSFVWTDKYRATTSKDLVLPDRILNEIKWAIESNDTPHMIFYGGAGLSKTTTAKVIGSDAGKSVKFINSSLETSIEVLREQIRAFSTTRSIVGGGRKLVILDEFEQVSNLFQQALKGFSEQFITTTQFILTTNHYEKIDDRLKSSRFISIDFEPQESERDEVLLKMFTAATNVLTAENIKFDEETLMSMVMSHYPDMRSLVNDLQRSSRSGELVPSGAITASNYKQLFDVLENADWPKMREWVANNVNVFSFETFIEYADTRYGHGQQLAELILLAADYDYKNNFVSSVEVNIVAFLTQCLMKMAEYK